MSTLRSIAAGLAALAIVGALAACVGLLLAWGLWRAAGDLLGLMLGGGL